MLWWQRSGGTPGWGATRRRCSLTCWRSNAGDKRRTEGICCCSLIHTDFITMCHLFLTNKGSTEPNPRLRTQHASVLHLREPTLNSCLSLSYLVKSAAGVLTRRHTESRLAVCRPRGSVRKLELFLSAGGFGVSQISQIRRALALIRNLSVPHFQLVCLCCQSVCGSPISV